MPQPVFAFVALTSGSFEGAIIRDMRLANELHSRGHRVLVYWMMETNRELVHPQIPQRILCHAARYQLKKPSNTLDFAGRLLNLYPAPRRRRFAQQHTDYVDRLMSHLLAAVCDGDPGLEDRLERWIIRDGVTHLMPTFAMMCPFAQAVKSRGKANFDYLVTFQGEEIFANYAARINRVQDYYARLRSAAAASGFPSVAVSHDYIDRLHEEMGIDATRTRVIYPGIDLPTQSAPPPFDVLKNRLPRLQSGVPIVTYFGRQDSEKGIDLLLYAVKILQEQGVKLQLVACGGSSFGLKYREVCEQIAGHLRVNVIWKRRVSDEIREALYTHSRCIVYPSIHREPFGMVAPEAMSHGTPVLVPDQGGITEAIRNNGSVGGLTFNAWDTADLAAQLKRLVTDDALHAQLAGAARSVASHFSVKEMTDQVLMHLGLPTQA